ncbi:DUF397 domain-containing protein [Streptomyces sp. CFMR 7]|nr:DUF397 domain-containing protein [Streptomyces sp. CFMR 7]
MEIQWRKSSGAEGNAYVELAEQGDEILLRESGKPDMVVRMT